MNSDQDNNEQSATSNSQEEASQNKAGDVKLEEKPSLTLKEFQERRKAREAALRAKALEGKPDLQRYEQKNSARAADRNWLERSSKPSSLSRKQSDLYDSYANLRQERDKRQLKAFERWREEPGMSSQKLAELQEERRKARETISDSELQQDKKRSADEKEWERKMGLDASPSARGTLEKFRAREMGVPGHAPVQYTVRNKRKQQQENNAKRPPEFSFLEQRIRQREARIAAQDVRLAQLKDAQEKLKKAMEEQVRRLSQVAAGDSDVKLQGGDLQPLQLAVDRVKELEQSIEGLKRKQAELKLFSDVQLMKFDEMRLLHEKEAPALQKEVEDLGEKGRAWKRGEGDDLPPEGVRQTELQKLKREFDQAVKASDAAQSQVADWVAKVVSLDHDVGKQAEALASIEASMAELEADFPAPSLQSVDGYREQMEAWKQSKQEKAAQAALDEEARKNQLARKSNIARQLANSVKQTMKLYNTLKNEHPTLTAWSDDSVNRVKEELKALWNVLKVMQNKLQRAGSKPIGDRELHRMETTLASVNAVYVPAVKEQMDRERRMSHWYDEVMGRALDGEKWADAQLGKLEKALISDVTQDAYRRKLCSYLATELNDMAAMVEADSLLQGASFLPKATMLKFDERIQRLEKKKAEYDEHVRALTTDPAAWYEGVINQLNAEASWTKGLLGQLNEMPFSKAMQEPGWLGLQNELKARLDSLEETRRQASERKGKEPPSAEIVSKYVAHVQTFEKPKYEEQVREQAEQEQRILMPTSADSPAMDAIVNRFPNHEINVRRLRKDETSVSVSPVYQERLFTLFQLVKDETAPATQVELVQLSPADMKTKTITRDQVDQKLKNKNYNPITLESRPPPQQRQDRDGNTRRPSISGL